MENQLLHIIEKNKFSTRALLRKYIEKDSSLLSLYRSSKNITALEQLEFDFSNLPLTKLNSCLSYLSSLFDSYVKKNDIDAVNKILLIYQENRRGLSERDLFNYLKDNNCRVDIKQIISSHLSNFSFPSISEWKELFELSNSSFIVLPLINKLKYSDPIYALQIFEDSDPNDKTINRFYLPLKSAFLTIFKKDSVKDISQVQDIISRILKNENIFQKSLIDKLFESEELKDFKELVFVKQKSIISQAFALNKELELIDESEFESTISTIPKPTLLFVVIHNIIANTIDSSKVIWSYILISLEQRLGEKLHDSLNEYDIKYDSLNEKIITKKKTIRLPSSFNTARRKLENIRRSTKNNRLEMIQKAVK